MTPEIKPMLNDVPECEKVIYERVSQILPCLSGPRKFHRGVPSFLTAAESREETVGGWCARKVARLEASREDNEIIKDQIYEPTDVRETIRQVALTPLDTLLGK